MKMAINLNQVRKKNVKHSDVYTVGRTIPQILKGNSLDISSECFNEHFAKCICVPVVYNAVVGSAIVGLVNGMRFVETTS